jgi:carbamoylphosphate synthase large subunit
MKRVLFSEKVDWEPYIRRNLKGYSVEFAELATFDVEDFDLVIPLTLDAQKHINQQRRHWLGVKALVPSDAAIDICHDKAFFHRHMSENGFGAFLPKMADGLVYPYLHKKRRSGYGVGTSIIGSPDDPAANRANWDSCDYIRQELIFGNLEYATHLLVNRSEIGYAKTIQSSFETGAFVKGQACKASATKVVDHGHLHATFKAMLNSLDYQGLCCIDYKLESGQPKIFEINPRFGGSLCGFITEAVERYDALLSDKGSIPG